VAKLEVKNLTKPDEQKVFAGAKGGVDLFKIGAETVVRAVMEPGWQCSKHAKSLSGTKSCQSEHFGYVFTGHMKVVMDSGEEAEIGPGDVFIIPPGHDAWTLGHHPCEILDFRGMKVAG